MAASLLFNVIRHEPVMVTPAAPTPMELKRLSDIDDQEALRFHICGIHIYRGGANSSMAVLRDPACVIREALAKALVFYYPFAGRLKEGPERKLMVECNAEGALFVEADADFSLDQFGAEPQPPFPCLDELIYGSDNSGDFLTSPLLTIQVTRLKCGGFILAHRINHTVADAAGAVQFLKAVAEIARGAESPSVPPVWARELLSARDPPFVTHDHPEYDELPSETSPPEDMVVRSFFFGPNQLAAMKQHMPPHLRKCTRFEVLTASLWRSRTIAIGTPADEEVRARFILNARNKCNPPLPAGYYGNAIAYPVARTTAGELRRNPLSYAVELVRAAKNLVTDDYLQSVADLMVLRGRPLYTLSRTYRISDLTRLGFEEVDFGLGESVYSGPAVGGGRVAARGGSNYIRYRNGEGEDGILVPVSLPAPAMERFEKEMERMTREPPIINNPKLIFPPPPSSYQVTADV